MPIYALGDLVPDIDPLAFVHPDAVVIGGVHVAAGATIWPGAVLRADYGRIEIGANTSIQDGSVLHTTEEWPTVVGANCVVGHRVHLEGCVIEEWALVGSGSVVLNRSKVGQRSVVGAGAVVSEDLVVPPDHLAVGVPARLKPLIKDRSAWTQFAVQSYVDNGARYRSELRRLD